LAWLLVALAALAGCGEEGRTQAPLPPVGPPPLGTPARGPSLAIGITEQNPNLVAADTVVPPRFAPWRDALGGLRPGLYRLVVDWSVVQPRPDLPPDLDAFNAGCMRDVGPCAPYAGVRDQLRALASRQRASDGWEALVVFTGTPKWAQREPAGCRDGAVDGGPRPDALPAYRRLVADVLAAAAREGAELRYLSPWNEPNHPMFLAPQRAECDAAAPSLAAAPYAELAAALRAELTGGQRLVLGETAGILPRSPRATSVAELIGALPRDLVCATPVWSQHAYVGGTDPVSAVASALAAHGCPREHAIWITETGVGPAPEHLSVARRIEDEREACRLLHERLAAWHADPRVTVAAQYTFREDDRFPTGLVSPDLGRPRPALAVWQAWAARPARTAPPPAATCG
jgi:hypothetical protein